MAKTNKILPYIIFGVPILIGGFFLYKYIKKPKKGEDAPNNYDKSDDGKIETTKNSSGNTSTKSVSTKYFPLKKGSKGGKVKELQDAILMYDSTLLPKFGADSDFGSETLSALNKILGKSTVDSQEDIDSIIKKANDLKKNQQTQQATETANKNRISLAQKLIDLKKSDKDKDFYPLFDKVYLKKYTVTSDGREIDYPQMIDLLRGSPLYLIRNTTFKIDSLGNIKAYTPNGIMYLFNPYSFEVR
jgi:hypothetical protein